MVAQLGMKNGELALFHAENSKPQSQPLDREHVQVITGGLQKTLLPLGLQLLQQANVLQGDAIILVVDNNRTSVACMLAAMKMRCVCALIGTSRIGLLKHLQYHTGIARVVVVDDAQASVHLEQDEVGTPVSTLPSTHNSWLQHEAIAEQGCVCMLTSGSVGEPKVVACTWESALLQGQATHEQLFPDGPARVICATSISHAYSINAIFTLFMSPFDEQSELCFAPTTSALYALLAEQSDKFTLLYGTPGTYTALLAMPAATLYANVPYCAGARLTMQLFNKIYKQFGLQLMQNYGSTEMGDIAAWYLRGKTVHIEAQEFTTSEGCYVGSLWPGVEVTVQESGEVFVKTPWQSIGYVQDCTLDAFNGAPHRTADLGYQRSDTNGIQSLWLQERLRPDVELDTYGRQVRYPPKAIEKVLLTHPHVSDAMILMPNKSSELRRVRARVVIKDGVDLMEADLTQWIADQIPGLRGFCAVDIVPYLPCSPAGKLMYS